MKEIEEQYNPKDVWMGIKRLKSTYNPRPCNKRDHQGNIVPQNQQAETVAKYLAEQQWGVNNNDQPHRAGSHTLSNRKIVNMDLGINESEITLGEVDWAIRKLKRSKAPGPDHTPMEFYKELQEDNKQMLLELVNTWWNNEHTPPDVLMARVVMIFKKGDADDCANYRPISLLNSVYKIYAAIIKRRLAEALEVVMQPTQFGFRADRSTIDALYIVRKLVTIGEGTQDPAYLLLLDWAKAFDKVKQDKLMEALWRMGAPPKLCRVIKSLYNHPTFCVEMDGYESKVYEQQTGIRQGRPLSPYLFLVVMTAMFHDIKADLPHLADNRLQHIEFDEILFADDTIIFSADHLTLEEYLQKIQFYGSIYGSIYGLSLNLDKCELLRYNQNQPVHFLEGQEVKHKKEAKYLGCWITNKGDAGR